MKLPEGWRAIGEGSIAPVSHEDHKWIWGPENTTKMAGCYMHMRPGLYTAFAYTVDWLVVAQGESLESCYMAAQLRNWTPIT